MSEAITTKGHKKFNQSTAAVYKLCW